MRIIQIKKSDEKMYRKNSDYITISCTRPGILGNPFPESKYGLAECLELYEEYFCNSDKVLNYIQNIFNKAISENKDIALSCYCTDKDNCHTLTIKNHLITLLFQLF